MPRGCSRKPSCGRPWSQFRSSRRLVLHVAAVRQLGVSFRPSLLGRDGLRTFGRGTAAFGVSALVLAALSRFDVVLLEAMKGAKAVASYTAAYRLFETVLFVTFAVN